MLLPNWPSPEAFRRRLTTPQVRRRVDAAQRRGLRNAVMVGGAATALFVALDAARSVQTMAGPGRDMALIQLGELTAIALLTWLAARRVFRIERVAMALILIVLGVTALRLRLLPESAILSVAYMTTVLIGSGLFLPWSPRWHGAWLVVALAIVGGALVLPGLAAEVGEPMNVLIATGSAAFISFIGHRLWRDRLRRMLEQQFELREISRYARRQEAHVTELNRELTRVARRDWLTGLGNRLALDEVVARLLDRGDRTRPRSFALVLLDIDHFKRYNDRHGHMAGDAALARLGEILRRVTRGDDLAFRYGGEEFLLVLPDVRLAEAIAVADRVRAAAAEDRAGGIAPFTVSGGVALSDPADGPDPDPLFRRADAALYAAKDAGRDRIAADELSVAMQRPEMAPAR